MGSPGSHEATHVVTDLLQSGHEVTKESRGQGDTELLGRGHDGGESVEVHCMDGGTRRLRRPVPDILPRGF